MTTPSKRKSPYWQHEAPLKCPEPLARDETICPASDEGGHVTTCDDCELCSGLHKNAKSIAIFAHGQRIKWFGKSAGVDPPGEAPAS